jgi:glycosyltransferase involved in cell wall biosynthesis
VTQPLAAGAGLRVAVTVEQCWHRVPGGTATSLLSTLRALQAHTDLRLVGVSAAHRRPPNDPFVPPVPVKQVPLPRLALYAAWQRLRFPPVTWVTGAVDAVWASGMVVPPTGVPTVVTVHDLDWLEHPEAFTRRGLRLFHRSLELTRHHAALVVCPSAATAAACRDIGIAEDRLRVVPWGIDAAIATDDEVASVRASHRLRAPYVLWVGTVEPRKNISAVVRAWRRLHDAGSPADLVLVGPRGWQEDLDALVGADRAGIHLLGFVGDRDLAALYRGAVALCYPSRAEGFGLPVLEAMAQGTPVVTSAGTATAEVAGDDGTCGILVEPDDVTAITRALDRIISDEAVRDQMGADAQARAGTFSSARTAAGMADAFATAAGGAR